MLFGAVWRRDWAPILLPILKNEELLRSAQSAIPLCFQNTFVYKSVSTSNTHTLELFYNRNRSEVKKPNQ